MKKVIYLSVFVLIVCFSCSKERELSPQVTYADFEKDLKPDMNYKAIVSKFGKPTSDIGQGIHIYTYKLSDSTEMWIGYTDKIIYARQMNSHKQVIKTLIGDAPQTLSFLNFKEKLKAGMNYEAIIEEFGEPTLDLGSGIHIYVYTLADSTKIWIGYTDKIIYARHMDVNDQLIVELF